MNALQGLQFWCNVDTLIRFGLAELETAADETEWIVRDTMRRLTDLNIAPLSTRPNDHFIRQMGHVLAGMINFEKQLYAVKHDRTSGHMFEHDELMLDLDDPFLQAMHLKSVEVQAEVARQAAKNEFAIEYSAGRWRTVELKGGTYLQ